MARRIMIVEDFEPFRSFLLSTMQQLGFQVVADTARGLEALRKAKELRPELVLLDIGLPDLSGLAVAKQLHELTPEVRLLFVSQESSIDIVGEAFRLGADGYVHKLQAPTDLKTAVEEVLAGKKFFHHQFRSKENSDFHSSHRVHFYSSDATLLENLSEFIGENLRANKPAIVLATKDHRDALTQRLLESGIDVDGAIDHGTFVSLDTATLLSNFMVRGLPDRIRILAGFRTLIESVVQKANSPEVKLFGECAGQLCVEENFDAAIQIEKMGNDLMTTHKIEILCGYPIAITTREEGGRIFGDICTEHTIADCR